MNIQDVLESEVRGWLTSSQFDIETAEELNSGYCKQFAKGVKDTFDEDVQIRIFDFDGGYSSYAHAWIEYNERHYDAECTEGVEDPSKLPFFRRNGVENPL